MSELGLIFDIKKYSINDGPGIRTTVFFQGCPLTCQWCHNPESQPNKPVLLYRANRCVLCGACAEVCPQHAITLNGSADTDRKSCKTCGSCAETCYNGARELSGCETSVEQVMSEVLRDTPFYEGSGGGVTFSGGEPLLQPRFLLELLCACRAHDLHTVVDTSGLATWEVIDSLRIYVDLFLFDLKMMDDKRHIEYTGVSNQLILNNLKKLAEAGSNITICIPLIPGINDDGDNLRASGEFIRSLPNITSVEIMGYHDLAAAKYEALGLAYQLKHLSAPDKSEMRRSAGLLEQVGLQVKIS
ncbi:MAG: glycyl-radical enzyme activating protein [Chloroflexi bacterium HGW-Chloroflexi-4]|jgi:pyruvate formate lyase activating enzyme|nr:MAG: glycyl-radical enzyme activating protein [Chloroflexi bacterium HGW-Chloroflexi-4]